MLYFWDWGKLVLHNFAAVSAISKSLSKKNGNGSVLKISISTEKVPNYRVSSILYFLGFEPNTKIYILISLKAPRNLWFPDDFREKKKSFNLCIQLKKEETQSRKFLDTFCVVDDW